MKLPAKLKYAREKIGYTLLEASRKANIPFPELPDFERGTWEPSFLQLSRLATIYKRDTDFFLNEDEPTEETFLWCK